VRNKTILAVMLAAGLAAALLGCAGMPTGPGTKSGEATVEVGNGIIGTLAIPAGVKNPPAVLMLHGFGSYRDEVGNMYAQLASELAAKGVTSLRIDFRGFGKSDGDTGAATVEGQVADAQTAYAYLVKGGKVDASRIGVIGFSLGGGISAMVCAAHPDWFKSMVTWSSVGEFTKDFLGVLGQEAFDTARAKGIVGLDLGWRTIVLKKDFFDSLERNDIAAAIAKFHGAYLAIAGSKDFSAAYAPGFVESAPANPKEAWIVPNGDHIYGVFGDSRAMANSVISKSAEWFAKTL
jgi:uncharacterized protein